LLYNELALTYDVVSWLVSLGAWRCWVKTALQYVPMERAGAVLELAHGTGNLQLDLAEVGIRSIAIDLSAAMGRIASAKLSRNHVLPSLVQARVQYLPFKDSSFSAVISTFPTDFIIAPQTLVEVHRVLGQGGIFIIIPNATMTSEGMVAQGIEWLYRVTGQRAGETNVDTIAHFFEPYGFRVRVEFAECPRSRVMVILAHKG